MKLITEYTETDVQCVIEKKEDGTKSHVIEGVFMQAESKNRNGRIYPKPIMEKAVGKYVDEQVSKNNFLGREMMLWVRHKYWILQWVIS